MRRSIHFQSYIFIYQPASHSFFVYYSLFTKAPRRDVFPRPWSHSSGTMVSPHILLFGDQVVEKLSSLRDLYSISKTRPQLRRFLREATDSVHCQLSALTPNERRGFGHFSDLLELAQWYAAQEHPDEIVGATLITTTQLGEYLA